MGPIDGDQPTTGPLGQVAEQARLGVTQLTRWDLLHRGDFHFDRILEELAAAERSVSMEMYQIRHDPIGWQICAALGAAAGRGVTVRLLLDRFGSSRIRSWIPDLKQRGVDVRWYNPWTAGARPFRRTHRKLIVVDGTRASIGGINVAAEFSEQHSGGRTWRDLGLWIEGPVVNVLASQFERAWADQGGTPHPVRPVAAAGGSLCAVAGGAQGRDRNAEAIRALIESARRELLLATPYFIPDAMLRSSLRAAALRGVEVIVVVPRRSDIPTFKHASRRLYSGLLRAGVEIRERCDRMVHAKVAVVDRELAAVGSLNLNRQSLYNNSETLLLTTEPGIVHQLLGLMLAEGAHAMEPLCRARWRHHPDRRRWAELVAAPVGLVF
jgi:cardiolipin synthase